MPSTLTNSSSVGTTGVFPSSPTTVAFGFTATAGRLLALAVGLGNIDAATTPTGWSLAVSGSGGNGNTQIFYKIAAGGETSVDVPHSGLSVMSYAVAEFDSIDASPLDKTATGGSDSSNTTAESGTTASLSQADEVVLVAYRMTNPRTITAASGFTNVGTVAGFGFSYKVVSATTAVTANATWSGSGADRNCMATFKSGSGYGVTGTAAGTFGLFTASASGAHGVSGTATATFGSFTGSASGTRGVTGTATGTFGAFAGSAAGTHGTTGTATAAWAGFSATATGAHGVTGTAAGEWSPFEASATGSFGADVTGTAEASWPAFTATATGTVCVTGDAVAAWAAFTGSASGAHGVSGAATATMPQFTATSSGRLPSPWRPKVVFVT